VYRGFGLAERGRGLIEMRADRLYRPSWLERDHAALTKSAKGNKAKDRVPL
jgi:hypothetical protein